MPMHAISFFRDDVDARDAVAAARIAAPDVFGIISYDVSPHSKWITVCVDDYVGSKAQAAIKAIRNFAARLEVEDPERARCGDVHGKWLDPKLYLTS